MSVSDSEDRADMRAEDPSSQGSSSPRNPLLFRFARTCKNCIEFLVGKILEIRNICIQLKAEVACIDRRQKEIKHLVINQQTPSHMDIECS
ncbi:hypothetical protein LSAT2_011121 [Lamellibrachia satsuma]|nr:hypothetical protein LSAT2_011121 [Lamellibrachia satsuma]